MIQILSLLCCAALAAPAWPARMDDARVQAPPGTVLPDRRTPYFAVDSRLAVGNKGEEVLDVAVDPVCGQPAWVFDHADLVVHRSRFGAAQFVSVPTSGCTACEPLVLRWYHEPTGHLAFSVNVHRRLEIVSCSADQQPRH
ncbi:MAG: hypothetical protein KF911_01755 [Pseudomonadales bacterium]|nr:hypothetical protein [Pseudomonadales bacterium]